MNDKNTDSPADHIEAMFVQTATSAESANGTLTLRGLAPSTLYFSDRPQRVVGHLSTSHFIGIWGEGENSFAADPPNAVLAFLEPGKDEPQDAVVVLREPRASEDGISYRVKVLEASLPARSGACSLFIDPLGRPLSPVSVAGMHRRARRRARR